MIIRSLLFGTVVCFLLGWSQPLAAAPEPSIMPQSWQLEMTIEPLRRIDVHWPGQSSPMTYWYLLYQVVNNTHQEIEFVPTFHLTTPSGQVLRDSPDPNIFAKIKQLHGQALLENSVEIIGPLLQGEDNARDGVAIWSNVEPQADAFTIYAGGFSGEASVVRSPATGNRVLLRRNIRLQYGVPGDAVNTRPMRGKLIKRDAVMR